MTVRVCRAKRASSENGASAAGDSNARSEQAVAVHCAGQLVGWLVGRLE